MTGICISQTEPVHQAKRKQKTVLNWRASLLAAGASVFALASSASAQVVTYGGLDWYTDRWKPDTVQVLPTHNGKSNVLQMAFGPLGEQPNRAGAGLGGDFWQYQGLQAQTNLPGGRQSFLTMAMWTPTAWGVNVPGGSVQGGPDNNYLATIVGNNTHVESRMWGVIPANAAPGFETYPMWGFVNDALFTGSTPGAYYNSGEGPVAAPGAGAVNYGAWNTYSMEYRDTQVRFYINNVLAQTYTFTDPNNTLAGDPSNVFKAWIINQFNYETIGSNNYNNFSAALSDYWNFYYADANYGIFTNTVTTLTTALPNQADLIVESGTTTVASGAGTTGTQGLTKVLAPGTLINNGTLNGGLENFGTATNNASGTINAGSVNFGTFSNAGTLNAGVANAGTFNNTGSINGGISNNGGVVNLNAGGNLNGGSIGNNTSGGIVNVNGATTNIGTVTQVASAVTNVNVASSFGSLSGAGTVNLVGTSTVLTIGGLNTSPTYSGAITGVGGLTKVGTGNMTLSGANTFTGPTTVNGGTLTVSGGAALADATAVTVTAPGTLALTTSETIGSLAGTGIVSLGGNTLTTGGNNGSTSFTGTTSGTGGITKSGTGTFQTLALANTGTNTVNGGNLNTNGAVAGSVVVNAGGTFSGNANIAGNLTVNAGGVLSPGNSPGTTNVAGNYIGGGSILVEVQFNNAAAPVNGTTHDLLNITGNVSNVTTLNVVPFAPSTAPVATTGNGIEVVRVGGTTAAGAFALSGPVIQGGFQYLLRYLPDYAGTSDGYFLQSVSIQEVSLNAALLGAGRAANMACAGRNHGHPGLNGAKGNVWADASDDSFKSDALNGPNGVDFEADTNCYRAGFTAQAGSNFQVGLSGGASSSSVDVNLPQGLATMDGDGVAIKAQAAWVKDKLFVEGALGYASTDWSIVKAAGAGVANATTEGLTGHLGAGYRTGLSGTVTATLSAALDYDAAACGGSCLVAGTSEKLSSWSVGAHARFDAALSNGRVRPYVQLGMTTDIDGDSSVTLLNAKTSVDAMSGLFHGDLGLEASVFSNLSLYAQGGVIKGLDSETTGHSGKVGAKLQW